MTKNLTIEQLIGKPLKMRSEKIVIKEEKELANHSINNYINPDEYPTYIATIYKITGSQLHWYAYVLGKRVSGRINIADLKIIDNEK